MKNFLIFLVFSFLFSGCFWKETQEKSSFPQKPESFFIDKTSHEMETFLSPEQDFTPLVLENEQKRLNTLGETFWYNSQNIGKNSFLKAIPLTLKLYCPEAKDSCVPQVFVVPKNFSSPHYTTKNCGEFQCEIADLPIPEIIIEKFHTFGIIPVSYLLEKNLYFVFSSDNNEYEIYQNTEKIFSDTMGYRSNGSVSSIFLVDGKLGIEYQERKWDDKNFWKENLCEKSEENFLICSEQKERSLCENEEKILNNCLKGRETHSVVTSNIFFDGKKLNEEMGMEGTSRLFQFEKKLGFVGKKNNKYSIFFNDKKISSEFDEIEMMNPETMIDKNGILFFVGSRERKVYFSEINLKKFL